MQTHPTGSARFEMVERCGRGLGHSLCQIFARAAPLAFLPPEAQPGQLPRRSPHHPTPPLPSWHACCSARVTGVEPRDSGGAKGLGAYE
eukprot:134816-Chlamydomonas_euryale.AAC.1